MSKLGAVFGVMLNYISFPVSIDETLILHADDILFKNQQLDILRKKNPMPLICFPEGECCRKGCLFTRNELLHINMNGFVEPCPFCQIFVDTIRDRSIDEIVNSDFFKELRQEFGSLSVKNGSCTLFENMNKVQSIKARFEKKEADFA